MQRRFTGYHMLAIMIVFFGTIIAVNLTMATFATRTFGGTVVDNSYVASQKFNGWLAASRAQQALGWDTQVELDGERHIAVGISRDGALLEGVTASGFARHPLGRQAEIALRFTRDGEGRLVSAAAIPAGRWIVHLELAQGADTFRLMETLQ